MLLRRSEQLAGETYRLAQGVFRAKATPQPDGRTRLELLPELQHDQPRQRWDVSNQGVWRLDNSRPKEVYDEMAIAADLPRGAMLIVGSLPNGRAASATTFSPPAKASWSKNCSSCDSRRRSATGCSAGGAGEGGTI